VSFSSFAMASMRRHTLLGSAADHVFLHVLPPVLGVFGRTPDKWGSKQATY
jgi:hypothetical protein